ncbi:hypothetical protein [Alkalitalea saponilacus]|uniref:Uncharacterized protein n=1 Tax=Alkalitalea saponilacus TaxID=889453 RepID=A0A1T5EES3_9BACT|nr:hypothetical protein [Alkalitalea saponilacus]SKB82617.1 hypothetical protein SAMN03080601_01324 [Alkalitalea saponilacus]
MKKLVLTLMTAAALLFVVNATVSAQEAETKEKPRTGFVDTTGDSVCDNYDGKRPGKGLGPGSGEGQGVKDGTGRRQGRGQGLRDGKGRGERRLDGTGSRRGERRGSRDGSGPNCNPKPESE